MRWDPRVIEYGKAVGRLVVLRYDGINVVFDQGGVISQIAFGDQFNRAIRAMGSRSESYFLVLSSVRRVESGASFDVVVLFDDDQPLNEVREYLRVLTTHPIVVESFSDVAGQVTPERISHMVRSLCEHVGGRPDGGMAKGYLGHTLVPGEDGKDFTYCGDWCHMRHRDGKVPYTGTGSEGRVLGTSSEG